MARRLLLPFALVLIVFSLIGPDWSAQAQRPPKPAELEASGALLPAPINATFDTEPSEAAKNSAEGRAGVIEPPGWKLSKGGVRPEKEGGPDGRSFALLHQGEATLTSSAFTVADSTKKLDFRYKATNEDADRGSLKVFVLSGDSFKKDKLVFESECPCDGSWRKAFIDVSEFSGKQVELRFVRDKDAKGEFGIADVASDLLSATLGVRSGMARAGDPVNTSTGNFEEALNDIPPIPGLGVPLEFTRYYNAQSVYAGDMGSNWTHTYSTRVESEPDASKTVRYPDGHLANFEPVGPRVESVTTSKGFVSSLSWSDQGTFTENRLMVVGLYYSASVTLNTVTYANEALTKLSGTTDGGGRKLDIWYLVAPPVGSGGVVATFSTWTNAQGVAVTYSGAAQAAPTNTTASGNSTTASVTVNTGATDLLTDFVGAGSASGKTITPGSNQAQQANFSQSNQYMGVSTQAGVSPSLTHTWTISSALNWAHAGVRVAAANTNFTGPIHDLTTKAQTTYSSLGLNHTTTSAPNRVMLLGVYYQSSASITSVLAYTLDPVADDPNTIEVDETFYGHAEKPMLLSSTSDGNGRKLDIWYLLNPAPGTHLVAVYFSGSVQAQAVASTYFNAGIVLPIATTAAGNSTTATVTVSSTENDLIVDFVGAASASGKTLTPGSGQLQLENFSQSTQYMAASLQPGGSSSVSPSWTISSTLNWAMSGVRLAGVTNVTSPRADMTSSLGGTTSSLLWPHITTSANNRMLVVGVFYASSATLNSVTYASYPGYSALPTQKLTKLSSTSDGNGRNLDIWYLIDPSPGLAGITATLSGSVAVQAVASTYSNAANVVPVATTATGNSTTATVSVSSNSYDIIADFVGASSASGKTLTPSGGQAPVANFAQGTQYLGASLQTGMDPSVSATWSISSALYWAHVGVRLAGVNISSTPPDIDTTTTAQGSASYLSWNHFVSSAPNRVLLVSVYYVSSATVTAVSANNGPLTLLSSTSDGNGRKLDVWYRLNPSSGTNGVGVTFSGGVNAQAVAMTFTNAANVTPIATTASGSSTTASVIASASANDAVADFVGAASASGQTLTPATSQTQRANFSQSTQYMGASSQVGLSPSVTPTWTISSALNWAHAAVRIVGVSSPALGPVLDTVTSYKGNGSVGMSHTTTDAPDRVLIVALYFENCPLIISTTYGSQDLQLLSSTNDGNNRNLNLYYVLNPASGPNYVSISMYTSGGCLNPAVQAAAMTFYNAVNVVPSPTVTTGNSTSPSVTVTSAANDIVADFIGASSASGKTLTPGAGQVQQANSNQGTQYFGASVQAGASPSVTSTWTISSALKWVHAGFRIQGVKDSTYAPPVFDSATEAETIFNSSSLSWNHTTSSAGNRVLLVGVYHTGSVSVSSVTYNNRSLSLLSSTVTGSRKLSVLYLLNPDSGYAGLTASLSGSASIQVVSMTFSNAANVALTTTTATGSSTTAGVTVNTTVNDVVADFVGAAAGSGVTLSAGSNQQQRANFSLGIGSGTQYLAASTSNGQSSSVTPTWSLSSSLSWAHAGVRILAAGTASVHPITYAAPAGNYDQLVQNTDGTFTLTSKSQIRYGFNNAGKLTSIKDRNNNTTTIAYDGNGRLSTVTDASSRTLTFTSNAAGYIDSVTDPLSRVASYTYTGTELTGMTDVMSNSISYTYDSGGKHLLLTNSNALSNPDFSNTFDDAKRVVKQLRVSNGSNTYMCFYYGSWPPYSDADCTGVSPSAQPGQTVVVDARGNKTTYSFNTAFRTMQVKDAMNNISTVVRDANFNVICSTDPLGNKTAYTYDARGNRTATIDALNTDANCNLAGGGVQSTATFTALNDPDTVTDALGRQTVYSYDGSGNRTQVISKTSGGTAVLWTCYTVGGTGLVTASTESTTLTNCTGNTTGFGYDSYGNKTSITNARFYGGGSPPQTTMTYDLGGRTLTVTNELSHTTTNTYNNRNQVLTTTDNLGNVSKNTYDAVGKLKTVTDALHAAVSTPESGANCGSLGTGNGVDNDSDTVVDDGCPITIYTYDNLQRATSMVDPFGTTTYTYDVNDNLTSVTSPNRQANGSPETGSNCGLGGTGNGSDNDSDSSIDDGCPSLLFTYDALNRQISRTDALNRTASVVFDAVGRMSSSTDAKSQTVTYGYSDRHELTSVDYPIGTSDVTFQYDAVGNRTQMADGTGTTTYTPDSLNRLSSVTFPGSRTVSYTYDEVGNRETVTYAGGVGVVTYGYDAAHNLTSVTDWNSNQTAYAYNNANMLTTTTLPSGTGTVGSYTYDNADRLTGISWVQGGSTTLASVAYTLNADSSRTQRVDQLGTHTYSYDTLQRLTSVTYPGPSTDTYTFDANGNRLTKNSDTYVYDAANQLSSVTPSGQSPVSYTYDNNGNLTNRGSDTFGWDAANRLSSATVGPTTTTFTYNGDGLRSTRTTGGVTVTFTWDVGPQIAQILDDGTFKYVYGLGRICEIGPGTTTTYYLTDGLGSTMALIDATGAIANTYNYDVYGEVRSSTGSQANEFTFDGEQRDSSTGLIYLRDRYYDPLTGRFLGQDKASSNANRFSFARGNPVNLTDPSGLYEICPYGDCTNPVESTDVGLPADPPVECSIEANVCIWADGSMYPYEPGPGQEPNTYLGNANDYESPPAARKDCGVDLNCDGVVPLEEAIEYCNKVGCPNITPRQIADFIAKVGIAAGAGKVCYEATQAATQALPPYNPAAGAGKTAAPFIVGAACSLASFLFGIEIELP